jgi:hypothetical protein
MSCKCGYKHAPNEPQCYKCELCGCDVHQDLTDREGRTPNHPQYTGVEWPIFICNNVDCGHRNFWD